MATVGDLLGPLDSVFGDPGVRADEYWEGIRMLVDKLQDLGIWDAEVLEGVEFLEHGDEAVAFEPPVRVIVLPKEKE